MIQLNNNVYKQQVENLLNQIGEFYTTIGNEVLLYPFKIVSGITQFTETGEQELNYNSSSFTSVLNIINSNDPIVCYWLGSYKQANDTTNSHKIKDFKVGKFIKTWIYDYSTRLETDNINLNDNTYTTTYLSRSIRSFSVDWMPSDDEMSKYLYIYLDPKANSPQFLQLTSKTPRYLPSGKFAGCDLEFSNLNQKYSQSGKNILNYVKLCEPGGNYAFPKEIQYAEGTEVELDPRFINMSGAKDIQLEFNSGYALCSLEVYGRPHDNKIIEAPRRLLIYKALAPISSRLNVVGSSAGNYYAAFAVETMFASFWNDWKEKVSTYYNMTAKKTFMGGFKVKPEETEKTNPINEVGNRTFNLWSNWTFAPQNDYVFECPELSFKEIKLEKDKHIPVCNFINHNSFIYQCIETLPLEFSDSVCWSVGSSFGWLGKIISGFISLFTFGFDPGWTTHTQFLKGKGINLLIPTATYDIAKVITSAGTGQTIPTPFDVFNANNEEFSAGGNMNVVSSFRFSLSDLFRDEGQTVQGKPEGKGGNGIWNTIYLGQDKYEDGTQIFPDNKKLEWNSSCVVWPASVDTSYNIDIVKYCGLGKSDCRMNFFRYVNKDESNLETIYENRHMTNSKFKNDIHLWRNMFCLNFTEEMTNEGTIDYPKPTPPPPPVDTNKELKNLNGVYNEINMSGNEIPFGDSQYKYNFGPFGYRQWESKRGTILGDKSIILSVNAPLDALTKKEIDLRTIIGSGNLDLYDKISFDFTALQCGGAWNYDRHVDIYLKDLPDNKWFQVLMVKAKDLGDAYPKANLYIEKGSHQWLPMPDSGLNDILETKNTFEPTSDVYCWIKLDKQNEKLQFGFDNPYQEDTMRGSLCEIPWFNQINGVEDSWNKSHGFIDNTVNIPHIDFGSDVMLWLWIDEYVPLNNKGKEGWPNFNWKEYQNVKYRINNIQQNKEYRFLDHKIWGALSSMWIIGTFKLLSNTEAFITFQYFFDTPNWAEWKPWFLKIRNPANLGVFVDYIPGKDCSLVRNYYIDDFQYASDAGHAVEKIIIRDKIFPGYVVNNCYLNLKK